jgi:hypothetical protein
MTIGVHDLTLLTDLTDFCRVFFNGFKSNGHKKVTEERTTEATFEKNSTINEQRKLLLKVTMPNYF